MSSVLDALGNPDPAAGGAGGGAGGAGGGAGGAADPAAGGGAAVAPVIPPWMEGLSDEYRSDPDLIRYGSVEDLAKGLKETRTWARGRIPIPADDAGWQELGAKLRPENVDGYKIDLPEGDSGELAGAFKQFAFDEGIPPRWAESTAKWFNNQQAEMLGKIKSANEAEVKALDLELGTHAFNVRAEAVANMMQGMGIENFDPIKGLESSVGAGATLKFLFQLAEKTGELQKVDGNAVSLRSGNMTPEAAQAAINEKMNDKAFMTKAREKGTPENKQWDALNAAAAGVKMG